MAPEPNLSTDLGKALSIDFTERFTNDIRSLMELLGVQRITKMANGTLIKTYTSSVTLDNTTVAPGEVIPLSKVKLEDGPSYELRWDKKRKAVTIEDVQKFGFAAAITKTDDLLFREIQKGVRGKILAQLATGTGTATGKTLQEVMAQNWAKVGIAFEEETGGVISFVNPMDVATYLGTAQISIQTAFGLSYLTNFLGTDVAFMNSSIPEGTVYATARDNLNLAAADVGGSSIGGAFDLTTDSTGIIGITHDVNKQRLTAETVTVSGIELFAERLDGIIKGTIVPGG